MEDSWDGAPDMDVEATSYGELTIDIELTCRPTMERTLLKPIEKSNQTHRQRKRPLVTLDKCLNRIWF